MVTPSLTKAAIARRSRSSIAGGLTEKRGVGEVGAARIGDGRDAHALAGLR